MPNTPRLNWPYPSENTDPWYEKFKSFVEAQDASVFAVTEDRNIIIMGGGEFTFTAGTNTLAWDATIEVTSPMSGYLHTVVAGSTTLNDGEMWYIDLPRNLTASGALTTDRASSRPITASLDGWFVLAIRRGTRIYFRNGQVLLSGTPANALNTPGADAGGGGGGTVTTDGTTIEGDGSGGDPITLKDTAVTPGSYTLANFTVDQQGRLTAASNTSNVAKTNVQQNFTAAQNVTTSALSNASSPVAVNAALSNTFSLTLNQALTLSNPTNLTAGATYIFQIKQDGTGGFALTFSSVYKFPGGTAPTITTAANAMDIVTATCDGTNLYCSFIQDVK